MFFYMCSVTGIALKRRSEKDFWSQTASLGQWWSLYQCMRASNLAKQSGRSTFRSLNKLKNRETRKGQKRQKKKTQGQQVKG